MVTLTDQSFTDMFTSPDHSFTRYPDPPHSVSNDSVTPSMDMYSMPTSVAFDQSLYADASHFNMAQNQPSPGFYADDAELRMPSSSLSTASATSSAIGSPQSNSGRAGQLNDWNPHYQPSIVGNDYMASDFAGYSIEEQSLPYEFSTQCKGFVDPSLIHPEIAGPMPISVTHFDHFQPRLSPHHHHQLSNLNSHHVLHHQHTQQHFPASPSGSSSSPMLRHDSASPSFLQSSAPFHQTPFSNSPYATPIDPSARRPSLGSFVSPSGEYSGDEAKEKQRCTYPDCGKVFKDLKAHMLTHQTERPEKCPIQTCEYHVKGFARKYDKNRHTLTHYKGTMVCGFCPGSGSPAEKSFNRADVFKRHLTAVHGVEQTPPNSRKKSPTSVNPGKKLTGYAPDATGKCSTCSQTFSNAQDFYEHLDDCVLRIVQQEDPAEAVNAQCLAEVENDKAVLKTLARNNVSDTDKQAEAVELSESEDDAEMADRLEDDDPKVFGDQRSNPPNGVQKSRGLTHSRGGVPLKVKSKDRKPKRYPTSWGDNGPRAQNMKKRVMACFDGPRRLVKDDMLLCVSQELRLKLNDGKHYVTDLDMHTLQRAEGFLNATDEEKGPWVADDPTVDQLKQMQEIQDILNTSS